MRILHRAQNGWIINSKSVMNAVAVEVSRNNHEGLFHLNHIVQILEEAGADIREKLTRTPEENRTLTPTTISKDQIRAILNREAKYSDSGFKRLEKNWYQTSK